MQHWPLRISRLIDHAGREHANREIVSRYADGGSRRTSWAGIARDARRLAGVLEGLSIKVGERVATLAMNHDRQLATWYGAIGMGAVVHTLNPRLPDNQLVYLANDAEDSILFYDSAFAPIVERLKSQWPTIRHYVCFDGGEVSQYDRHLAGANENYRWIDGDENEPALLCYTSGTTGKPKGVLYSHRSIILHAIVESLPDLFGFSARSTVMPIVPMFHAASWGLSFATAVVGAKLVLTAQVGPEAILDLIRSERVTHSAGVPTVWLSLMAHIDVHGGDINPLQFITIGGSAVPRAMIEFFDARGVRVGQVWGMTETSPIASYCSALPNWDTIDHGGRIERMTLQGRPPFGVELRVLGLGGVELPRDGKAAGGLQVRGPWVIDRYFRDGRGPATGADGWFDTGDVAILHPDGMVQITDRSKDLIKSGGEWISSIDLENAAVGCPGVAEAAAIAVPHPKWEERPLLLVVPKEGADISSDDVLEHLATKMVKWWLPDEVLFVANLPHAATGKLLKSELRAQYRNYRWQSVRAS